LTDAGKIFPEPDAGMFTHHEGAIGMLIAWQDANNHDLRHAAANVIAVRQIALVHRRKIMPRPLWTGAISFGLLNIPVQLLPGERRTDLHFRMQPPTSSTSRPCSKKASMASRGRATEKPDPESGHTNASPAGKALRTPLMEEDNHESCRISRDWRHSPGRCGRT
jgi:hypothetical protein